GLEYYDGQLWAIDETSNALSTIQISPVLQVPVGVIHVGSLDGPVLDVEGGDIARDSAGNWYLWSNATGALYHLVVTTAVVTPVDTNVPPLSARTGLAFEHQTDDALIASSRLLDQLEIVDPSTGFATSAVNVCLNCPTVYDLRYGDMAAPPLPPPPPTETPTVTPTSVPPTATATDVDTATPVPSATNTPTNVPPPPPTPANTSTATPVATATPTGVPPTPAETDTATPAATATATSTATATATASATPTATDVPPTATETATDGPSATPTATPDPGPPLFI